jgi:hypothetical protein
MQYNLNVQHEIAPNLMVTIGYAGARGKHLGGISSINVYPLQDMNGRLGYPEGLQGRPNPNFDDMQYRHAGASSWFDSLQVSATRRYADGLQFGASYTFGKNLDEISGLRTASDTSASTGRFDNYFHRDLYKGLSPFHIGHAFSFNSVYELPIGPGRKWGNDLTGALEWILAGWQVGGIVTLSSGSPGTISQTSRFGAVGGGAPTQPDLAPGASNNPTKGTFQGCALYPDIPSRPIGAELGTPDLYFDPCAFVPPPSGLIVGDLGRNTLILPGFASVDLSLAKNFEVKGDTKLQFRLEAFNVLNRPNFAGPSRSVFNQQGRPLATPGRITETVGTARQLQLALRFTF